jgi:hypothetical protein
MRYWRTAFAVATVAACGTHPFAPETLVGSYALVSIDGRAAPVVIDSQPDAKILLEATLEVMETLWRTHDVVSRVTLPGGDTVVMDVEWLGLGGTWEGPSPTALTFWGNLPDGTWFQCPAGFDQSTGILRIEIGVSGLGTVFQFQKQ